MSDFNRAMRLADFLTDALGKGTNISELKESPYTTHAFNGGPHRPMNPLDNTLNAERVRPALPELSQAGDEL